MFRAIFPGRKAFTTEQIRELKKLLFRTKALGKRFKKRIKPKKLIEKATNNMNSVKRKKYGLAPEEIEARIELNTASGD